MSVSAPIFRCADIALLRAPVLARETLRNTWAYLHPGDSDEHEQLTRYIAGLASRPEVEEAVATASPSLARTVAEVREGRPVELKRLRSAALSLSRYCIRMASRPTPFGLFSGVAAVQVSDTAEARLGRAHRAVVRPDMAWLTELLTRLETRPDVLPGLRVTVNDLAFVRGDRLVLPCAGRAVAEVSVRHTAAVEAALALAAGPVVHGELRRRMTEHFPSVPASRVDDLLTHMVEHEFLLTELRPDPGTADPLAHALGRLPDIPERTELAAVHRELGTDTAAAAQRMQRLHASDRPLQMDLALDAEVRLPGGVAAEAERAATALWRMSLSPAVPHLAQYHGDFLEQYGTGRAVPLRELLDADCGLGVPAGYLMPPGEREKPPRPAITPQAELRIELAQSAALAGQREVVLDDDLVARLSPDAELPPPASLELYTRVLAGSADDLTAGRFRLWLTPGTGADHAGATIGRFSRLLPDAARRTALACRDAEADGADCAQLSLRTVHARSANLTRVPRWLDRQIVVGSFADPADPCLVRLDDLAVEADTTRLHLVSSSTGRRIVPLAWNMLNPAAQVSNLGRFLREIRLSGVRPGFGWDWGPMEAAPYAPRVRYGRTVLAPARWRMTDPFFADSTMPDDIWRRECGRWRERWGVPDRVQLCVADRTLELNLAAGLHIRLLRQDVLRSPEAVLREVPEEEHAYGWFSGEDGAHAAEVVFPLLSPRPTAPQPARRAPLRAVRSQAPGGEWLYAKLYGSTHRQNELLTRHVPRLLAALPEGTDRWFFLRYRDPGPHLRLRFHGDPEALNRQLLPRVHDWFADLRRSGLAGRLVLDSYEPEWERYGGRAAAAAAEEAFCADSKAVLAQLGALESGRLTTEPELLGALNMLDIVQHALGREHAEEWHLATYPRSPAHDTVRDRRRQAAALMAELPHTLPGSPERAPALSRYGEVLRSLPAVDRRVALTGLVHLHHNRLLGIDPEAEDRARAIARGALEIRRGRRRADGTAARSMG
ncbi:lantibiotic dehydratase [Streptoverticillium reticulum]|uniref:lantibiotic dehydratase n=1 Tax=Streptoverticillium reticulum TaxID=1433415 RepID=UPI0039BEF3B8